MKKFATLGLLLLAFGAFAQFGGFFKNLQSNTNTQNNGNGGGQLAGFFKIGQDAGNVLKGANGIGLQEEETIGNSVAVQIVSRYGGLVRDPVITRRVNLIGKSLARSCERPELNFHFGVLNSPTVNAFSAPGGYVFITRGLYDLIQNDDELGGVLGHEIEHVAKKHALKIIARGEFLQGVAGLTSDAGAVGGKRDLTQYSQSVGQLSNLIIEKGFDPQTEYIADASGSQLAATVGYAPDGLRQCLQELQKHETAGATFFPTHPPLQDRITKLQANETARN
ncbi:MAG TPA: M48 family metalloprotease [Verrucomicrobiae bacterium]|jgi:predicted Zn-dependent protease